MDSKLDSIFRTTFRTTEKTDSWLGIKRDESEDPRKRREKEEKPEEDLTQEQTPTLSVMAVKTFLNGLLADAQKKSTPVAPAAAEQPHQISPQNRQNARAAAAYQHTAGQPPAAPPPPAQGTGQDVILSADEIRDIHKLLEDLDRLIARGHDTLRLLPAESFLQSLIKSAKTEILLLGQ